MKDQNEMLSWLHKTPHLLRASFLFLVLVKLGAFDLSALLLLDRQWSKPNDGF